MDELDTQISQMTKSEISAFKDFESVYRAQHPHPVKQKAILGWESWTTLGTAGAAVVLAAFRTAQAFYLAAVAKGVVILSAMEAISAVFAIEGSVILFALQRAREVKKTDAHSSELGLWVAFIISILAGLYQSINIVLTPNDTVSLLLSWSLAIAMGVGATLIAWLSGDLLGVYLVRLEFKNSQADEQFTRSMHSYRANMLKEWKSSFEQNAVSVQKSSRYGVNRSHEHSEPSPKEKSSNETRPPITIDEMYKIFDSTLSETGEIAGVGETARTIMIGRTGSDDGWENLKSRVSGARKKWITERGIHRLGE